MVAIKLDAAEVTAAYSSVLRKMASLTGFDQRAILKAEAGSILKTWAGRTKVGSVDRAELNARGRVTRELGVSGYSGKGATKASKSDHPITVNSGKRGDAGKVFILKKDGHGFRRTHNANFAPLNQHYKTTQWDSLVDVISEVQARWEIKVPRARLSVGLARQSVVQIADALGIDLLRVAGGGISSAGMVKARAAMASNGQHYKNGTGISAGTDVQPYIMLIDSLPYGGKIGMDSELVSVINGRREFFNRAYANGAFDSQKNAAKSFPNLFRVTAA